MMDFESLKASFDALPYAIFAKNADGVLIYGNTQFSKLIGIDDFLGKTDFDMFSEEQSLIFAKEDQKALRGQHSYNEERIGDDVFALTSKFKVTFSDGSAGLVGIVLDLEIGKIGTEARSKGFESSSLDPESRVIALEALLIETVQQKREALNRALTDPATGLRNRNGLEEDLNAALRAYEKTGKRFGLAFTDIDHFKKINDRMGHDMGDAVLKALADKFQQLAGVACAARLGGDEFALLFEIDESISYEEFEARMEFVHTRFCQPLCLGKKTIHATGSTGIAIYPDHGEDLHTLKQNADAALLTSKANGRNRITIFSDTIKNLALRRRLIEDGLHHAITNEDLDVAFQPIVCSQTKSVLSVEALARWTHPTLGVIPPDEFVDVAADCGLLTRLDQVIFKKGCALIAPFIEDGSVSQVSFNISPNDIIDEGFAKDLLERIDQTSLEPRNICVEIVETSSVHDIAAARINLQMLQEAGVCIALDDFGTGFSNLRSLLDLPLDRIKIDRSFIKDMESNQAVFDLFLTVVNLAGILEVSMVAEGLETDFNALMVASAGVTHLQGYFFAKPMPIEGLAAWLKSEDRAAVAA